MRARYTRAKRPPASSPSLPARGRRALLRAARSRIFAALSKMNRPVSSLRGHERTWLGRHFGVSIRAMKFLLLLRAAIFLVCSMMAVAADLFCQTEMTHKNLVHLRDELDDYIGRCRKIIAAHQAKADAPRGAKTKTKAQSRVVSKSR